MALRSSGTDAQFLRNMHDTLIKAFSSTDETDIYNFIFDASGKNILEADSPDSSLIIRAIQSDDKSSNSLFYKKEHTRLLLSYQQIPEWDLTIGTQRQLSPENFTAANKLLLIISLLNILFLCIGVLLVSSSIAVPIIHLSNKMHTYSQNNFYEITTKYHPTNEIGQLICCYNEMANKINQHIEKEIAAEKHRRHLELNLLQEQFKPHFLYNTIDYARVLCMSGDTANANSLLQAMGSYYQTILSKGRTTVMIKDEVNTIQQYEHILSLKGTMDFKIVYRIDPDVLNNKILKFILQPLVENCIKHGLYGLDDGIIIISFSLSDDDVLSVWVEDNGRGIAPEMAQTLIKQSYHSSSKGFGLAATLERLRLYYGTDCKIEIRDNNPGTIVSFSISHFSEHAQERNSAR